MSRAGSSYKSDNERGFTLIELVLVLAILALSTAIVLPNIERGLQDRQVRRSALKLAATARDLRSRALFDGVPGRLVVHLPRNSYAVAKDREVEFPRDVKIARVLGGESISHDARGFMFYPNGSSQGGEIVLSDADRRAAYAVRLHSLTGKIEVIPQDGSQS